MSTSCLHAPSLLNVVICKRTDSPTRSIKLELVILILQCWCNSLNQFLSTVGYFWDKIKMWFLILPSLKCMWEILVLSTHFQCCINFIKHTSHVVLILLKKMWESYILNICQFNRQNWRKIVLCEWPLEHLEFEKLKKYLVHFVKWVFLNRNNCLKIKLWENYHISIYHLY